MAQQNGSHIFTAALTPPVSPESIADPAAIFSAPDVVFQWWIESKRRWAARDSEKLQHPPVAPRIAPDSSD